MEELEHMLCVSDAVKRQLEVDLKGAQRELDEVKSAATREAQSSRIARDALHEEMTVLRKRLEEALADKEDLIQSIEPLEFEISLLRRESVAESHREDGGTGGSPSTSSDAMRSQRGELFRSYFNDNTAEGGSTENFPEKSREQQLLEVIEQSASVFVSLDQELRATQAELMRLKAEKENWLSSEYDLHAAIARLEREREQYIGRELENASTFVLATHGIGVEEARERRLLEAQADALLHGLAYQRCRNDASVISKHLLLQLSAMEAERVRDARQHENIIKFEVERNKAALLVVHEKALREMDARMETMRLERQKVELQNTLLKANCDEWRAHSEKKDREQEDAIRQLVGEAQSQMAGRDELIRSRDSQIAGLLLEKSKLVSHVADLDRALERSRDEVQSIHAAQQRRLDRQRMSYVQTDNIESPEEMKRRLIREIEEEDEVQLARRVTAHHLFVKLQDVATNTRTILQDKEQEVASLRASLTAVQCARDDTALRLATEERRFADGTELLRCEAEAASRRADLAQRQREIADHEIAQLQAAIERHQNENGRVMTELRQALAGQAQADAKAREAVGALEMLTSQLGVELSEGAAKTNALEEASMFAQALRDQNITLERSLLACEETIARGNLTHSVDAILQRLGSIAETILSVPPSDE